MTIGTKPDWTRIDQLTNAAEYIDFLDKLTNLEAARAYKARTFALLSPVPGQHLLDLGCGTGADVFQLASLVGPHGSATGVDINKCMIDESTQRAKDSGIENARFIQENGEQLSMPDATFDAARADRVLQHLPNPELALKEMIRVTKSGGRIAVSDPDWTTLEIFSTHSEVNRKIYDTVCANIKHASMGSRLRDLFEKAGLEGIVPLSQKFVITDLTLAAEIFLLKKALVDLSASSSETLEPVQEWLAEQQSLAVAGEFKASLTGFAVLGIKR